MHENTIIFVHSGTYDLITEFGEEYFANLEADTGGHLGLQLGNGVSIIFASNAFVICNYNGNNSVVNEYFSPFNFDFGTKGFYLENLHLECSNVRYGIHDEGNNVTAPYKNRYKNCHIYIDNSNNKNWNAKQCIGGGLGYSSEVEIDGCYFESEGAGENGIVTYHNATGQASANIRSNIVVKNSYFAQGGTVRCSYIGNQTKKSRMMVCGCSMGREPYKIQESSSYSVDNIELLTWNNEIRN